MGIDALKCFPIYKSINPLDLKEDNAEMKADVDGISKNQSGSFFTEN